MNKKAPNKMFNSPKEYIGTFFGYDVWFVHGYPSIPWLCQDLNNPRDFWWIDPDDWEQASELIPRELFDHLHAMSQLL